MFISRCLFIASLFFLLCLRAHAESYRIDVEGPINSVLADIVKRGIEKAENQNASFVVLRLNTPGGFDQAMRQIIEKILTSKVPIIVYVAPSGARAASAGFFILEASDLAVMAPGTNTGAAHPVLAIGGVYPVETEKGGAKTLMKKATNDAVAFLKGIAEKRGRNLELAQSAITQSKSFSAQEALDGKLIEIIARDEQELLTFLQSRKLIRFSGEEIVLPKEIEKPKWIEQTWREKFLLALADPNLALLLGLGGILLLYFEMSNPGFIVPAVLGALMLIVSFIGFSLLSINFVGVLLIVLAIGLFIAEIKVQGFGVLGIGGIVAMFIGTLILVDAPQPELKITPLIAGSVVIPFGVIFMLLMRLAFRSMRGRVFTGEEGMVGLTGVAHTEINLEGKVHVRGEYWDAVSQKPISEGKQVRVVKVDHLRLTVEEV